MSRDKKISTFCPCVTIFWFFSQRNLKIQFLLADMKSLTEIINIPKTLFGKPVLAFKSHLWHQYHSEGRLWSWQLFQTTTCHDMFRFRQYCGAGFNGSLDQNLGHWRKSTNKWEINQDQYSEAAFGKIVRILGSIFKELQKTFTHVQYSDLNYRPL